MKKPLVHHLQRIENWIVSFEDAGLTIFLSLLCGLSFVLLPLIEVVGFTSKLVAAAYSLLFAAGAFLGELGPRWRSVAIGLALVCVTSAWLSGETRADAWGLISLVTTVVFMVFLCLILIRKVFRPGEINGHRIRGAIAVYILIGFIFALSYVLLDFLLPGSFRGLEGKAFSHDMHDAVYFSFVTLTTLGYGDIVPAGELAQTLVIVEAVLGQLFVAILLARLVSLSLIRTDERPG